MLCSFVSRLLSGLFVFEKKEKEILFYRLLLILFYFSSVFVVIKFD